MNPSPLPRLMPVYTTPGASDPIQLYTGPIGLRQNAYVGAGTGAINLIWRVLGPEIRFEIPSLQPADLLDATECTVTAGPVQGVVPASLSEVNVSGLPGGNRRDRRCLPNKGHDAAVSRRHEPFRFPLLPDKQLSLRHRDRLAAQKGSVIRDPHFHYAAPRRRLERHEIRLSQPLSPEVAQATMSRASYRVFVNARRRGEKPRDEIEARID